MLTNKSRYFQRIRRRCNALENAAEVYQWDCAVFKVKGKVFAICNTEKPLAISLKPKRQNLDAYLYHPAIDIARYVGRFGWVTITIEDKDTADLALSLVLESYEVISTQKGRRKS